MSNEFPSNSKSVPIQPKLTPENEKNVESVITGLARKQKKSLLKRFTDVMVGGDSKSVGHYVLMEVVVPQVKDMLLEAASGGFEKLIFGEARRARYGVRPGVSRPPTNYARMGNNPIGSTIRDARDRPPNPATTRRQEIDDILLATRVEAELVLERLYDLLKEYDSVTVSDLYSLVGWSSSYTDQKWGWTSLTGSSVRRNRDGYVLELPATSPLD
jgi:hypothetical protein